MEKFPGSRLNFKKSSTKFLIGEDESNRVQNLTVTNFIMFLYTLAHTLLGPEGRNYRIIRPDSYSNRDFTGPRVPNCTIIF